MTKILLKKKTFNVLIAVAICVISVLPYLHDLEYFKGKKGFSGFSSLRIAVWCVSLFIVAISGWVFALIKSKGCSYRFLFLVPITMLMYQLTLYVLNARKHVINNFDVKIIINIAIVLLIALFYFNRKKEKERDE